VLQITPQMRIWLAVEPVDFRKGLDGLAALCRQKLASDPMCGALFVFTSKRRQSLRCLGYDGQGYWLCQKRWSEGRLRWWPQNQGQSIYPLEAHQLQLLLWNGNPLEVKTAPMWRRLTPTAA